MEGVGGTVWRLPSASAASNESAGPDERLNPRMRTRIRIIRIQRVRAEFMERMEVGW
jgi:hypothetical protein